ncbi:hypothetical protein SAMN06265360_1258 [Haloechinothrix alba]|uniref:Transcriptional regulator, AbiEi antitoxin, Type IV TA system n=1 Tax=Haloechinothrix alba TaxID=664784 RepID=A0A238ZSU6_9PSEU|nr:hypothetical protein [Haloechinothrix alba]SNR86420.1 hypothetical protein SAMN06265360_1258 [Haloechinothrix alba]
MVRSTCPSRRAIRQAAPDGVATTATLRELGVPKSTIAYRCRPGGPWLRLLPGVILLGSGPPTRRQRLRAAVAIGGPRAVITGADALRAHGLDVPAAGPVRLIVPPDKRPVATGFVAVERSSRPPRPQVAGGLPFAPPTRAATDLARTTPEAAELHRLLALVTDAGLATPEQLRYELDAGNQRGSSAVRTALRELAACEQAHPRGPARAVLRDAPLPLPMWNVTVYGHGTRRLAHVHAWWGEVALAWLITDGEHGSPTRDDLALGAAGVTVVRTPAASLRHAAHDAAGRTHILREICSAFLAAAHRPRPRVYAVPVTAMSCPDAA